MPQVEIKKEYIQDVSKMTVAQIKKAYKLLADQYIKMTDEQLYCHYCNKFSSKKNSFYKSIKTASGYMPICKSCLYKIATNYNEQTKETNLTRESIMLACQVADLPFIQTLYESGEAEVTNEASGKTKNTIWASMIKNLQSLPQYQGLGWENSDFGEKYSESTVSSSTENQQEVSEDISEMYIKNKRSVLRMLGYDPFAYEDESDKPLLYSKLVNYFDDSLKDDGFKLEAVIEIVQTFKDVKHINDTLAQYTKQLQSDPKVIATVKALTATKKDMVNSALALAKDNGISENNNNKKSKGAGTLSGIIKELQEMNLEEAEINTFDYETNQAIEDIMTRNHQNQLKQLNPDENDWEKEVIHQKDLLYKLQKERDNAVELCRLLRKENKDLKDFLIEKNLLNESLEIIENDGI